MRPAVFLDRDGVLNEPILTDGRPTSPMRVDDVRVIPGAREACAQLRAAGLLLIAVTNQPEVARGRLSPADLEAMNRVIEHELPLDAVYVCPHDDDDACACRKPKPGLMLRASAEWDIDLAHSCVVGDRWRDMEAGHAAGCATAFIDRRYAERRPAAYDVKGTSLLDVVPWIVARHARGSAA